MATKLKKFGYNGVLKTCAYIVCAIAMAIIVNINVESVYDGKEVSEYFSDRFEDTWTFRNEFRNIDESLSGIVNVYGDEEYFEGDQWIEEYIESERWKDSHGGEWYNFKGNSYDEKVVTEKFKEEYKEVLRNWAEKYKIDNLRFLKRTEERLDGIDGLEFYAKGSKGTIQSDGYLNKEGISKFKWSVIIDKEDYRIHPDLNLSFYGTEIRNYEEIYIGINDDFLKDKKILWEKGKIDFRENMEKTIVLLIIMTIALIYIIITSGRDGKEDKIKLTFVDKIYGEIVILLGSISVIFLGGIGILTKMELKFEKLSLVILFGAASVILIVISSLARRIKNRSLLKNTLCFRLLKIIFEGISGVFRHAPLRIRLIPTRKKINDFVNIAEGVKAIKSGNLSYEIKSSNNGVYSELAHDVNDIAKGLKEAVDSEVRSERLKTELISNVSHDIRTPLTSIINYVDLLKREEIGESGKEYLEILEQKSQRLKMLIENLFEASKASSGVLPVEIKELNVIELINQCMGEMDEKISGGNLRIIVDNPYGDIFIKCDGKHMWRVFENILNNIVKYSMSNSRVYINFKCIEDELIIEFKNISENELNVSEDELMERFVRGDRSRSTEGTGLGLSITESLCELQGGSFHIGIDGDLFKSIVIIPLSKREIKENTD